MTDGRHGGKKNFPLADPHSMPWTMDSQSLSQCPVIRREAGTPASGEESVPASWWISIRRLPVDVPLFSSPSFSCPKATHKRRLQRQKRPDGELRMRARGCDPCLLVLVPPEAGRGSPGSQPCWTLPHTAGRYPNILRDLCGPSTAGCVSNPWWSTSRRLRSLAGFKLPATGLRQPELPPAESPQRF